MSENVVIKKDRTVTVPASEAKIGVQYDHNVNVITFDCPRYPDDDRNVDMSTMQIYINYMLPDKTLGSYLAENVKVDTNNPDTIHFDWKITRNVTQVKGALQALVCIKKVDADGNELYHWNTDLIQSFRVGEGMECLETISSDYADVISQLLVNMNTVTGEFEALSADVTARTSEETLQGLVNNAASDEKLRTIVDAYMAANPVGINVDDTLTVSGDAADAKITGDRISELKSDLDDLFDYESYEYSMWEEGAFSLGVPTDSSKNIRTKDFVDLEKYYGIKSEKLYFRLYAYEPDGTFVGQFNGTDFGDIGTPVHDLSFDIPKKLGYKIKLTCNRENYIYNIYPWEELKLFFIVDKYSPKSEVFEIKETLDTKISTVENKLKSFTDLKRNTDKIGSCEIKVVDFDNASLSDDVIIENALNFSKGFEYRTLVFDTRDWNISKAILIPSNTTIVIDGVTIKQNDEIFDNMFRSGNIVINEEHPNTFPTSITKCENIKIIGKNGAKIIGCDNAKKSINPANNEEQAMETDAWGWRPIGILIVMCNNVEVCGIHFEQSHMWTVSFEKCTNGYVHDLDFYTTKVNHDGVDLRAGCKHFVIENITGTTFDDAVACTCSIPRNQTNETYPINSASIYPCEVSRYLNTDMTNDELAIEDVQVRNVCTGGNCRVVICYSAYGGIIRNVLYDTVSDTDTSESNQIAIFKIYKGNEYVDNSIYNIRVNNLKSNKTYRPVQIIAKSNDVHINKITKSGWMANDITYTDGVIITNVNNV